MRFNPSARMHVVQKEFREASLIELIQRDLSARRLIGGAATKACYRLIARSLDSPAARALCAVAPDAISLGIEIRVVLLKFSTVSEGTEHFLPAGVAWRLVSDPRFLDAHEQLVLSSRTTWIGDCMRRDAGKRDAYQFTYENCEETASLAARSFESIWDAAEPLDVGATQTLRAQVPGLIEASLLAATGSHQDVATVRH